ncbi:primosomal protein N' family DNA-binding protein [Guggenheimella bovis]
MKNKRKAFSLIEVEVALLDAVKGYDKRYSFFSPTKLQPGTRVMVPFGPFNKPREAVVLNETKALKSTKEILSVINEEGLLKEQMELFSLTEELYSITPGELLKLFLPKSLRIDAKEVIEFTDHEVDLSTAKKKAEALKEGLIKIHYEVKRPRKKEEEYLSLLSLDALKDARKHLPKRFRKVHSILNELEEETVIKRTNSMTDEHLSLIEAFGVFERIDKRIYRHKQYEKDHKENSFHFDPPKSPHLIIEKSPLKKRELMLSLIKEKRTTLLLVPSFTLVDELSEYLSEHGLEVLALHSRLTNTERLDTYSAIRETRFDVVVGTRNALFTPSYYDQIVVDEADSEHYYSLDPNFDTRTLVLEYSHNVGTKAYFFNETDTLLLPEELPRFRNKDVRSIQKTLVDTRLCSRDSLLSDELKNSLQRVYRNHKKSFLYFNKNGEARVVECKACHYIERCPSCERPMIYSKDKKKLVCKLCQVSKELHKTCPDCGKNEFQFSYGGIERLESEVKALLKEARVIRFDTFSLGKKQTLFDTLQAIREGDFDVLLATSFLSQALHLEDLELVSPIELDFLLNMPEYSSQEKTYQTLIHLESMLETGEILIQTKEPTNYVYRYYLEESEEAFFETERSIRKRLHFPPEEDYIRVSVAGKSIQKTYLAMKEFESYLNERHIPNRGIYRPIHERVGSFERFDLLVQGLEHKELLEAYTFPTDLRIQYFMNPIHFLY